MKNQEIPNAEATSSAPACSSSPVVRAPEAADPRPVVSHDAIEEIAYRIYRKNGCQEGRCEADWYQAESELRTEIAGQTRASEEMVDEGSPVSAHSPAAAR